MSLRILHYVALSPRWYNCRAVNSVALGKPIRLEDLENVARRGQKVSVDEERRAAQVIRSPRRDRRDRTGRRRRTQRVWREHGVWRAQRDAHFGGRHSRAPAKSRAVAFDGRGTRAPARGSARHHAPSGASSRARLLRRARRGSRHARPHAERRRRPAHSVARLCVGASGDLAPLRAPVALAMIGEGEAAKIEEKGNNLPSYRPARRSARGSQNPSPSCSKPKKVSRSSTERSSCSVARHARAHSTQNDCASRPTSQPR